MQIQNVSVYVYVTRVISSDKIKLWQCNEEKCLSNEENRRLLTYLWRSLDSPECDRRVCIVLHLRRDTGP